MIVLHAGVESNRFLLWGEMPHEDAVSTKRRKQSRKHLASAEALPYDAGESGLSENLKVIASDSVIHSQSTETVIVWLPTVAGLPLASSPLIAESLEPASNATLSPWKITALSLNPIKYAKKLTTAHTGTWLSQWVAPSPDKNACVVCEFSSANTLKSSGR